MIKCNINKKSSLLNPGGIFHVRVEGDSRDVLRDTILLVVGIYKLIRKQNPEIAEQYKNAIGTLLNPNSHTWEEFPND